MTRKKLKKFAELETFPNVFQNGQVATKSWHCDYFNNDRPLIVELACGWGEYTIGLAEKFPNKNFVGVDAKGARLWKGAKIALERNLSNVAFLRIDIQDIAHYFAENAVDEIWITFPDPHPKKKKAKKRLTAARFLLAYAKVLKPGGQVHLKTDHDGLFNFTLENLESENCTVHKALTDLYSSPNNNDLLKIRTKYEKRHLAANKKIKYVCFSVN
ncbi:tRNA (guanosine(46)-N7)-methyltransferase TrmB [candidate division KSB1 bacterium]|nr:tRNA (guanosine(46)-N7)-methyltransferase TrmB [candidate division KSB1 bacterium]NIR71767.1 tRNA (guanosine(46)-N7)-methyltransferase TrmB [candidate division KSB1 bacterium]NIS24923.1 tRNA (guanosine(46)-N7)-methyltransferase TrmB [candidate division KSB1 bacterium]NIT71799.1 tRNA (guanosine(46)-N7)-methyltransferase TrmB [candidate division KSB1 bacterium]NIU25537.1 tRNA (guanosine(46)-N7)-methyltransferase TrmB [candidate division KSB1 bacterium]